MKLVITSNGEFMNSKYCPYFEECEYLIIYDTKTKEYASRKSPSFYSKKKEDLINFLKATFMKNIITGKKINDKYFKVFLVKEDNLTIEEVILKFLTS